ncbi:MAG: phosphoglycerate mutase (2,3-diphosphoglycerate-independent), partial [Campylobacterota bacterium]|nr:phosphoglycerate mutase (2,3-diphosphoglycerate-independent) [Campylobacterota bacterium]
MSKKAILVITDGIGYSPKTTYNAFHIAKTPTYDKLFEKSPNSLIETSGLSVGLPDGQMGNSEVGHMSIGSGRVLYQDLVKISLSLKDNSFSQNEVFRDVTSKSSRVHLVTLLSNGGVHSHIEHLIGVLELLQDMGKEVFIHVITDGRDVSPSSAIGFIDELKIHLGDKSSIASLAGRFYTM